MNRIIIVDDNSVLIAAAIKRIMETDICYVAVDYELACKAGDYCLHNPSKDYGWYNKFNKTNKRDKYKS